MRNCAWIILRGASDASTESVTVGPFAPKAENDINRIIARQQKSLPPQREPFPIPPPELSSRPTATLIRTARSIYQPARGVAAAANAGRLSRPASLLLSSCYHLRRACTWKIYYLRRSRRQRKEHPSREVGTFPARPRPFRHHHPRTGRHHHRRKDSRSIAALRHLGTFSAH